MRAITMSLFGNMGRFGNQLFQYAFLRLYAKKHNLRLQLPPWVGNELFGCDEPPITLRLPKAREEWKGSHLDEHIPPKGDEFVNTDWSGYAQYHTAYYRPYMNEFRNYFRLMNHIREPLDSGIQKLRKMGHTVIGAHYRKGDFGRLSFHLTPVEWYKRWLRENWGRFKSPILFLAAEDRSIAEELSDWSPVFTDDFGIELQSHRPHYNYLAYDIQKREPWQLDFVPDWYTLTQCDVLVISNSTFGFTAAMMNERLRELWRSSLPAGYFEHIDPWDARPFRTERCEDPQYAHLKGIRVDHNPYW